MKIRPSIAYKLTLLLVLTALLPLVFYGVVSLWQAGATAKQTVIVGNHRVAVRAADQINQYVEGALAILKSVGENIKRADLKDWQRQRVVRNMSLEFQEFREISLFDGQGHLTTTSAVGSARLPKNPLIQNALSVAYKDQDYVSDVFLTNELTPALIAAFPLTQLGKITCIVAAEIDLLHMWRFVGGVKIGKGGYLNVVLPDGKLIASGSGGLKKLVLQEKDYPAVNLLRETSDYAIRYNDNNELLVSIVKLPKPLGWFAIVEQPAKEAYALARRMTWQLIVLVVIFIIAACLAGYFGGKWQILTPIKTLIRGTRAVSKGDLECRVSIKRSDEFGELAFAFNQMTADLHQSQENIKIQERLATFGRIASGLVHDLKHPIKSIENASHLMDRMYDNEDYRKTFIKTVNREFEKINNFLSNLHTLTHDIPYNPMRLKLKPLINDVVETFNEQANKNNVRININMPEQDLVIRADKMSMPRALSNIVINGIQAMPEGGDLKIEAQPMVNSEGSWIELKISDTGCGIPPSRLDNIFADFVTTKRRGLGLGLALTKRIIDQHGATIEVSSEVDKGTIFTIRFLMPE